MMPRQLFAPARAMDEEFEDASDSTIKVPPPFILPPEAEQKLGENPEILQVIFKALESIRKSFIERKCIPPDDFEILLLLTYGLKPADIKDLTRKECTDLEEEIRILQFQSKSIDEIKRYVASSMQKRKRSIIHSPNSAEITDRKLESYQLPPFGTRVSQQGKSGWFLHSFLKFSGHGLPEYLVCTDAGEIEIWSPVHTTVIPGDINPQIHCKAYPIEASVVLVKAFASLGFPLSRAKIIDSKIKNGVLKILVRHPDDKTNEYGDMIEEWVTPDKISSVG